MSTPPEQPNPSPYQNPPDQGSGPAPGPPQVGGYGTPVPAQHNPYAQPSPYGPQPAGYYAPPGAPGMPPGPPGQPGGPQRRGGAGRAVLWAVVGAVVASALWGGGVLLLGKDSKAKADLRGYTVTNDLCGAMDVTPFQGTYPKEDDDPSKYTAKSPSVDEMYCDEGLEKTDSTFADSYLSAEMDLHKKTDPGPEFGDSWRNWSQHDAGYKVTPVSGYGDEAYLITSDTGGSRYVTFTVREGWMTFQMGWSVYSTTGTDATDLPTVADASKWLETSTKVTLAKLK